MVSFKESNKSKYGSMCSEEVLRQLDVDPKSGLSDLEAKKRLEKYGLNHLVEKKESLFTKLLAYFWGPIPWMIEIAAILSAAMQKWSDLIVILAMLFVNAALGFFQEYKAGNAIAALKKKLALKAHVIRNGELQFVEATKLVPGDVVSIKLGNIIPADIKLISGNFLSVDQSSLTGESLPVDKGVGDMAFSGTVAKSGEMIGVVTETGMDTFFGKTAKLISEANVESHFKQTVLKIGNCLIILTLVISTILLVVSLYRIEVLHDVHFKIGEIVIFILVLVVAGIPVALPAVFSATMAIGAHKLAKLRAIVSKLTAVEELASMTILCSDKTGTITKNELTIGDTEIFAASDEEEVKCVASLASNLDGRDAIDSAIYSSLEHKGEIEKYVREKYTPFDPVSKRASVVAKRDDGVVVEGTKGAPQVILALCSEPQDVQKRVADSIEKFAHKGFRTLGVAKKDSNGEWRFLGLISLFDPPRNDTKETLHYLNHLGIDVKMLTGDQVAIAKELSKQLDLGTHILPVSDLTNKDLDDNKRDELIEEANGFAEVFPEHKFSIVKTLQKMGRTIGMTGDGVNDAPALKQANIGIAVSGSSDAANESADIVLTEPGLLVIVHAVEQSRMIFNRMKSYAMYRISETFRILFFLFLSMLVMNDHPLTAIMIILIALLNDVPIMMIAYDNMPINAKPTTWNMKEIFLVAGGLAFVGVISTFGLYWIGDVYWFAHLADETEKLKLLRTLAFMGILCGGNLTIYLTRNTRAIWSRPFPEWKFFLSTLFSLTVGTLVSVYGLGTEDFVGIGWKHVGLSWAYILSWFLLCMLVKELLYIFLEREMHIDSKQVCVEKEEEV